MKHLKKILFAVVLMAMLISSIVNLAFADGDYTGDLTEAKGMLDDVIAAGTLSEKYAAAAALSVYLETNPVDPDEVITVAGAEGEPMNYGLSDLTTELSLLIVEMNSASILATQTKYESIVGSAEYAAYLVAQQTLKNFLENTEELVFTAPEASAVYPGILSVVEAKISSIDEKKDGINEYKTVLAEIYEYLVATPVDPTTDAYYDFFVDYRAAYLKLSEMLCNNVDNALTIDAKRAALASYADYIKETPIAEAVVNAYNAKLAEVKADYQDAFDKLNNIFAIEETPYQPAFTGTVVELNKLVSAYYDATDFESKYLAMKASYDYLVTNPVDPASEGYEDGLYFYAENKVDFIASMREYVETPVSLADKVAAISVVNGYLSVSPISTEAVNVANAILAELKATATDAVDALSAPDAKLEFVHPDAPLSYVSFVTLNTFLAEVDGELEDRMEAMAVLYSLVRTSTIDTSAPEYAAFLEAYTAKRSELEADLLAFADADLSDTEKLAALDSAREYLLVTPLSTEMVAKFNAVCDEIIWWSEEEAEAAYISNDYTELEALIGNISDEATLAENLAAFKALYTYRTALLSDITDPAHAEFVLNYNSVCVKINALLVEHFASAVSVEDIFSALGYIKGYLTDVPFSEEAINSYNTKVESLLEAFSVIKVDIDNIQNVTNDYNIFFEIVDSFNSKTDYSEMREAYEALIGFYAEVNLDVTDTENYLAAVAAYEAAGVKMTAAYAENFASITSPNDKVDALAALQAFALEGAASHELKKLFNDLLDECLEGGYDTIASSFTEEHVVSYVQRENDVTLLDSIAQLIAVIEVEDGDYTTAHGALVAAVEAMKADNENGARLDFTSEAFFTAIKTLNGAKRDIADAIILAVEEDSNELSDVCAIIKTNDVSYLLVETYNSVRASIASVETESHETAFAAYLSLVNGLKSHLESCPIDIEVISAEELVTYRALVESVCELDEIVVDAYIVEFGTVIYRKTSHVATTQNNIYHRILKYIDTCDSSAQGYSTLTDKAESLKTLVDAALQANSDRLNDVVKADEYAWNDTVLADKDFENGKAYTIYNTGKAGFITESGNTFWRLTTDADCRFDPKTLKNTQKGTVVEFDFRITSWSDIASSNRLLVQLMSYGKDTGARLSQTLYTVKNGGIYNVDGEAAVLDVIEVGVWYNIAVAVNTNDYTTSVYLNDEYVGTWSCAKGEGYDFTELRVRVYGAVMDFDNIRYYQGTSPRDKTRITSMSDYEKLNYYLDYINNPEISPTRKPYAYAEAKGLANAYRTDPQFTSLVAKFDAYNYNEEILYPAQELNLAQLMDITQELSDKIDTGNYIKQQNIVKDAEEFLAGNMAYIDQSVSEYAVTMDLLTRVKTEIVRINNLLELIESLKRFERAPTLAAMTRHFADAKVYYDLLEFDVGDNYDKCKRDAVTLAFVELVGSELEEYYKNVIPLRMDQQSKYENAKRVIDCIDIITSMEGYESTEAFWSDEENYEFINTYLSVVQSIVRNDRYDPSYDGIDEALEVYEVINAYFFEIKREAQVDVLREKLEAYTKTHSYIEKAGICTYLDNYILENDIKSTDEGCAELFKTLEAYKQEVAEYKEIYSTIIESNTVAFIALVDRMGAYVTYSELKPLYTEAIDKYYYNMNIDSEDAQAAIALFAVYEDYILSVESDSAMFVECAKSLQSYYNNAAIYKGIVACAKYADNVSEDILGVIGAKQVYEAKLAAYYEKADVVNAELEEVNSTVCAVRAGEIASVILATIKSIFSK